MNKAPTPSGSSASLQTKFYMQMPRFWNLFEMHRRLSGEITVTADAEHRGSALMWKNKVIVQFRKGGAGWRAAWDFSS